MTVPWMPAGEESLRQGLDMNWDSCAMREQNQSFREPERVPNHGRRMQVGNKSRVAKSHIQEHNGEAMKTENMSE